MDLSIDENEFWAWCKEKNMPVDEVKRRWGNGFAQKIQEVNWQNKKIDDAQNKLLNILKSDEIGKTLNAFLMDKNVDELKKL